MENLTLIKPEKVQNIINKFCYTIGMIPTSYKMSLTYEGQILAIGHYLEETVIPALNNNAEAVAELQSLFVQLKDYVETYFDNLDVQEEINNKLDKMVQDGTLQEIITSYLKVNGILAFDSIDDMKNSDNLIDGSFVRTYGYNKLNDKKGAFYKIRQIKNTDVVDNINIIAIKNNNLIAELMNENEYILKSFGTADHLGIGNETVTKAGSTFSSCVASIRANRKYTLPNDIVSPGIFTPTTSKESSLYSSRDSVALFVANEGRPAYLEVLNCEYTENSVTYPADSNITNIEIGMIIDTSDKYSGIIIEIDKNNNKFIIEDSWYKNGEKGIPTGSYIVGQITKLWTSNTIVKLKEDMPQKLAVGEEMDLDNYKQDGNMVGHDVVTSGPQGADIAYLARTGFPVVGTENVGKLENGFVSQNVNTSFSSRSNEKKKTLLMSFNSDGQQTQDSFQLLNDGTCTNIKNQVQILTADNQEAPARCKYWIFKPTENINYTLPNISEDPDYWNNREFIFVNRSNYNVTLSNGYTITPFNSAIFITLENLWIRIFPE